MEAIQLFQYTHTVLIQILTCYYWFLDTRTHTQFYLLVILELVLVHCPVFLAAMFSSG